MKKVLLFLGTILSMFLFTDNVYAKEVMITSTMSQTEINDNIATLNSGDKLIVAEGNYGFKTLDGINVDETGKNYHKAIILETADIEVVLSGTYTRFELVVRAENTTVTLGSNTVLNGEASITHNTAAAFALQSGTLNINTGSYVLYIKDYNNGIRMGYNRTSNSTDLTIVSGSTVDINAYYSNAKISKVETYYDSYNDHGDAGICGYNDSNSWYCDGAVGAGIYTRGGSSNHTINIESNATLNIHEGTNSGIYLGYDNVSNKVTINVNNAILNSNNNKGAALFEDGALPIFQLNAINSTISFSNNGSNGITGHTTGTSGDHNSIIYLDNSTLNIDGNHSIGANNSMFYLKNNSHVTCLSTEENKTLYHGLTNIALMMYDSTLDVSGVGYRGVNINRDYEGQPTTINNSYVTVTDNGQSGIYLLNSKGTIVENGSHVTTNGNGIKAPSNTFSGDGIVASYNVTFVDSYLTSTDYHAIATSETSYSPSTIYIKEYTVAVSQGTGGSAGQDVVEDICSSTDECKTYTGTIVITGGSFEASNEVTVDNYETYVDNREDVSSSVKIVNDENEDLYRFTLHSDINSEVGGEGAKEFVYYYKNGNYLTYKFIYDENGNAYVWTPISILHYDATEGVYINSATALYLTNRFGKDITIYGNSLNLAEKYLADATREGYVFLGWFIADDQELAAKYADEGNWDNLYALLNTSFDASTKLEVNGTSVYELTVYAKWAKVDTEIDKNGSIAVDDSKDIFDYTINYSATVEEYSGTLKIVIIDEMEYAISLDNSDIVIDKDNIILNYDYNYSVKTAYNNDDKTITWIIVIDDVNTYLNGQLIVDFSKDIKLYYLDIPVSVAEVNNKVVGNTIIVDGNSEEITIDTEKDEYTTSILYRGAGEEVEVMPPKTGINVSSESNNILELIIVFITGLLLKITVKNEMFN